MANYSKYPSDHSALRPLTDNELREVLQQHGPYLRQVLYSAPPRPHMPRSAGKRWEIRDPASKQWFPVTAWAAATREYGYHKLTRHLFSVRENNECPLYTHLFPKVRGRVVMPDIANLTDDYASPIAGPGTQSNKA